MSSLDWIVTTASMLTDHHLSSFQPSFLTSGKNSRMDENCSSSVSPLIPKSRLNSFTIDAIMSSSASSTGRRPRHSPSPPPDNYCENSHSPASSEITTESVDGRSRRGTPSPAATPSTKKSKKDNSSAPNPFADLHKERCNCEELSRVVCTLENKDLWDKFNELGTEMIITKTGR